MKFQKIIVYKIPPGGGGGGGGSIAISRPIYCVYLKVTVLLSTVTYVKTDG